MIDVFNIQSVHVLATITYGISTDSRTRVVVDLFYYIATSRSVPFDDETLHYSMNYYHFGNDICRSRWRVTPVF